MRKGRECGRLQRFGDCDPGIRKVSGSDQQSVVCGRSLMAMPIKPKRRENCVREAREIYGGKREGGK